MNSNKRDIYFWGSIYKDCEKPTPNLNLIGKGVGYNNDAEEWVKYLNKLTSYPVSGPHSWKDGEDVTGLYSIRPRIEGETYHSTMVAVATPKPEVDNLYELKYCESCVQMTNHKDGVCQKCKPVDNLGEKEKAKTYLGKTMTSQQIIDEQAREIRCIKERLDYIEKKLGIRSVLKPQTNT